MVQHKKHRGTILLYTCKNNYFRQFNESTKLTILIFTISVKFMNYITYSTLYRIGLNFCRFIIKCNLTFIHASKIRYIVYSHPSNIVFFSLQSKS